MAGAPWCAAVWCVQLVAGAPRCARDCDPRCVAHDVSRHFLSGVKRALVSLGGHYGGNCVCAGSCRT